MTAFQTILGTATKVLHVVSWQTSGVISGSMNSELFDLDVTTQLVLTLREGDVVILDNMSSQMGPGATRAPREVGAWFLFWPPYSPDRNPIEMAISKLKSLIRKAAAGPFPLSTLSAGFTNPEGAVETARSAAKKAA